MLVSALSVNRTAIIECLKMMYSQVQNYELNDIHISFYIIYIILYHFIEMHT